MSLLFRTCLIFIALSCADSRPDGAPTAACGTMIPGHSGSGENSQSPFTTKPTNVISPFKHSTETLKINLNL